MSVFFFCFLMAWVILQHSDQVLKKLLIYLKSGEPNLF